MFSCEYCKISNNNFFHRTLPVAVSALYHYFSKLFLKRPFNYSKQRPSLQYTRKTLEKSLKHVLSMHVFNEETQSLLFTFGIFHVLFWGHCCWLWEFVCLVRYFKDLKNISGYFNTYPMSATETLEDNQNLTEDYPNDKIFKK